MKEITKTYLRIYVRTKTKTKRIFLFKEKIDRIFVSEKHYTQIYIIHLIIDSNSQNTHIHIQNNLN